MDDGATGNSPLREKMMRRERLVDMERRLQRSRRIAFAFLAAALIACGPWLGWWWLAPLALAGVAFAVTDRLVERSDRPELWAAAGWAVAPLLIAFSVALTGAADSPALAWFALPAISLQARFERRGVLIGVAYIVALMLASTLAIEPGAVADDPTMLILAFAVTLAAVALSSALAQSDREHRQSAVIDPLTGLLNRTALAQRAIELEDESRHREGARIGLAIADLDHFKRINDEHGHAAGDAVLRDVAYAMRGALRAFDLIYRVGGEEFLVLLPGAGPADAARIGERLRVVAADCSRPGIEVKLSVGAATAEGVPLDFGRLYERADEALYAAKQAGRDRLELAGEPVAVG